MKRRIILGAVTALILSGAAPAQQTAEETNRAILEELRGSSRKLDALTEEIVELRKEAKAQPAPVAEFDEEEMEERALMRGGPDLQALSKIKFPENPTEESVREYIRQILASTKHQNMFGSDDPHVGMLAAVGPDWYRVLAESRGGAADEVGGFGAWIYIDEALEKLSGELKKEFVVENLATYPSLVRIILDRGWEQDVSDVLKRELHRAPESMHSGWGTAAANLRDPETYADLKIAFAQSNPDISFYDALRSLPGFDLDAAVAEAWQRFRFAEHDDAVQMAQIAIQHGHVDALLFLARWFKESRPQEWRASEARRAIGALTPYVGDWHQTMETILRYSDQITWDAEKKQYLFPAEAKP